MTKHFAINSLVEVRPASEILATLDDDGCLDGLPFMPEMLDSIGKQYRVHKIAHKTCDTVTQTGGRSMRDTVHLSASYCDGSGHGECDARCLVFWKTQWLRPARAEPEKDDREDPQDRIDDLRQLVVAKSVTGEASQPIYRCQATLLLDATKPLPWWSPAQYWRDWASGNTRGLTMLRVWFFHGLDKLMGLGVGYKLWRRIYDALQPRFGGHGFPRIPGKLPKGSKTPVVDLGLQPGELVRIKSHEEILETLDYGKLNRGMRFDEEMVPYCGKTYRVARRVDQIVNERTGEMLKMKTPSFILDGVFCRSQFSNCRLFCPRELPSYWREIWLERVESDSGPA